MKKFRVLSLLAAFSFLFITCNKDAEDQDTTAPKIMSVTINDEDHDIVVMAGSEIHINAHVTDNEALGELKVDIHDIFDGHSHGKTSAKWAEVLTIALSGKEQHVHEHTDVPQDATAGPYHAIFRLIDAEGNEGEFAEIDFMITNGSQPQINITDPDVSGEVDAPKGSTLSIFGTVSDDTDLAEVRISLEEEHDGHEHKSTLQEVIYEEDFDLTGPADTNWDFQADGNVNIVIPSDAQAGHYVLRIIAVDNEGNMNIFEAEVHID
ncbi:MAG: DUF4625 domain-containing protein [Owenweeksia sp.]